MKHSPRSVDLKHDLSTRLKRIEGQIRGIEKMVDADVYCDDIINQVISARSALKGVMNVLLEDHMQTCVAEKLRKGDKKIAAELLATVGRML